VSLVLVYGHSDGYYGDNFDNELARADAKSLNSLSGDRSNLPVTNVVQGSYLPNARAFFRRSVKQ